MTMKPANMEFAQRVEDVVRSIPFGRVMTYGDVAAAAGAARAARAVGALLRARLAGRGLPWHRVINAAGAVSARGDMTRAVEQRRLLEAEGHRFDERDKLDLGSARWLDLAPEQIGGSVSETAPDDPPEDSSRRHWYLDNEF